MAVGDAGQRVLDRLDPRRQRLRLRQAEQRQRAIGLDLQQPLRERAGARRTQALVEHQDADEAVGIGAEIGGDDGAVAVDLRHGEAGGVEQTL